MKCWFAQTQGNLFGVNTITPQSPITTAPLFASPTIQTESPKFNPFSGPYVSPAAGDPADYEDYGDYSSESDEDYEGYYEEDEQYNVPEE